MESSDGFRIPTDSNDFFKKSNHDSNVVEIVMFAPS